MATPKEVQHFIKLATKLIEIRDELPDAFEAAFKALDCYMTDLAREADLTNTTIDSIRPQKRGNIPSNENLSKIVNAMKKITHKA